MSDKVEAWIILISLIGVVAGAYVLAWRGKLSASRRGASWVIALVSGMGAIVATSYVIEALEDFHNPEVSLWMASIGTLIILAISIGAWVIAIKFAIFALRRGPPHKT